MCTSYVYLHCNAFTPHTYPVYTCSVLDTMSCSKTLSIPDTGAIVPIYDAHGYALHVARMCGTFPTRLTLVYNGSQTKNMKNNVYYVTITTRKTYLPVCMMFGFYCCGVHVVYDQLLKKGIRLYSSMLVL